MTNAISGPPSASAGARIEYDDALPIGRTPTRPHSFTLSAVMTTGGHERNFFELFIGGGTARLAPQKNPIFSTFYAHTGGADDDAHRRLNGNILPGLSSLVLTDPWVLTIEWDRPSSTATTTLEDMHGHSAADSYTLNSSYFHAYHAGDALWLELRTYRFVSATAPIRVTYFNAHDDEA